MRLATKRVLDRICDDAECRRMSCVLQSVEYGCTLAIGNINLPRTAFGDIDADDAIDFVSVWLHGD